MKKNNLKKGFSLIEVIVAMSVITMVVFAATTLLVSIIRSNSSNINRMIAYGLAQEGLEAVRNIRDSDWLLGATFDGKVGKFGSKPWGDTLPPLGGTVFYTVDSSQPVNMNIKINSSALVNYVPWKITSLSGTDEDALKKNDQRTRIYKNKVVGDANEIRYMHLKTSSSVITPFHRYIIIKSLPYTAGAAEIAKYRVTSVVFWSEFGRDTEVRLDTELTDWKQSTL
jgi:prepilin-type N-terminal cleavage/methylation domain-containing protein